MFTIQPDVLNIRHIQKACKNKMHFGNQFLQKGKGGLAIVQRRKKNVKSRRQKVARCFQIICVIVMYQTMGTAFLENHAHLMARNQSKIDDKRAKNKKYALILVFPSLCTVLLPHFLGRIPLSWKISGYQNASGYRHFVRLLVWLSVSTGEVIDVAEYQSVMKASSGNLKTSNEQKQESETGQTKKKETVQVSTAGNPQETKGKQMVVKSPSANQESSNEQEQESETGQTKEKETAQVSAAGKLQNPQEMKGKQMAVDNDVNETEAGGSPLHFEVKGNEQSVKNGRTPVENLLQNAGNSPTMVELAASSRAVLPLAAEDRAVFVLSELASLVLKQASQNAQFSVLLKEQKEYIQEQMENTQSLHVVIEEQSKINEEYRHIILSQKRELEALYIQHKQIPYSRARKNATAVGGIMYVGAKRNANVHYALKHGGDLDTDNVATPAESVQLKKAKRTLPRDIKMRIVPSGTIKQVHRSAIKEVSSPQCKSRTQPDHIDLTKVASGADPDKTVQEEAAEQKEMPDQTEQKTAARHQKPELDGEAKYKESEELDDNAESEPEQDDKEDLSYQPNQSDDDDLEEEDDSEPKQEENDDFMYESDQSDHDQEDAEAWMSSSS